MLDFDIENGTWTGKDGKLVKYTKETRQLSSHDDWSEYHLQITSVFTAHMQLQLR